MLNWEKKDRSSIESCLGSETRAKAVRKERRDRWISFAMVLTGLGVFWIYRHDPTSIWQAFFFLILGFHAHAMSTANLRLAKLAEAIAQRTAPG